MYGGVSKYLRFIKAVLLTVLLAVYIMGSMKLNGFHELLHNDNHITHLQEDESDGCHRAIYHNDKAGCEHKTHVTTNHHCHLCDFILTADQEPNDNFSFHRSAELNTYQAYHKVSVEISVALLLRSRAPPMMLI
jgi:hypothetical protein